MVENRMVVDSEFEYIGQEEDRYHVNSKLAKRQQASLEEIERNEEDGE